MATCSECREEIKIGATRCPHCSADFSAIKKEKKIHEAKKDASRKKYGMLWFVWVWNLFVVISLTAYYWKDLPVIDSMVVAIAIAFPLGITLRFFEKKQKLKKRLAMGMTS